MSKFLKVLLIILVVGVIAFVITLKNGEVSSKNSGTVNGYVHVGPTCPVVQVGREEECQDRPYSVSIEIHYPDERLYKIIKSDDTGRFSIGLSVGEYILRPQVANVLPACEEKQISVSNNTIVEVDISCDSGIR